MNLIDKYIVAVGRHLPRKNRADIEAEIRSTLEDMLEERTQASGAKGPADEAMVVELLKEYGSPGEVAATYKTRQYLIGPRMYPIFERVLRIVITVVVIGSFIGLGLNLSETGFAGGGFASALGEWFGNILSGLIAALGNVVLVFAILERTQVVNKFEKESKEWDPKELNESEIDPDRVDLPDHIATIIFTFLALVILNLYPNLLSITFENSGIPTTISVLTDVFFRFLPWINVLGLVQISFNGFMLSQQEWKPGTRIIGIVIDIAEAVLPVIILKTPGIFGFTPDSLAAIGLGESAEALTQIFDAIPAIVIIVIVVVTAIKVGKSLMRLIIGAPDSPYLRVK